MREGRAGHEAEANLGFLYTEASEINMQDSPELRPVEHSGQSRMLASAQSDIMKIRVIRHGDSESGRPAEIEKTERPPSISASGRSCRHIRPTAPTALRCGEAGCISPTGRNAPASRF